MSNFEDFRKFCSDKIQSDKVNKSLNEIVTPKDALRYIKHMEHLYALADCMSDQTNIFKHTLRICMDNLMENNPFDDEESLEECFEEITQYFKEFEEFYIYLKENVFKN